MVILRGTSDGWALPLKAQRLVLRAIRRGCDLDSAADVSGVRQHVLREWLYRGAQPDAPPQFAKFARQFHAALAESELELVECVRGHAAEEWRAAAWLLERRHPERWGPSLRLNAAAIERLVGELSGEELAQLADVVRERVAPSSRLPEGLVDAEGTLGSGE